MASTTPSTSFGSETAELPAYEIKEAADYRHDAKVADASDDEKAINVEDAFVKESWNNPPANKYRLCSSFALFTAASLFLSCFGVLIPEFEKDYHLSHITVSLITVGLFVGAVLTAATTNKTHLSLGRCGTGVIAGLCMGLGSLLVAIHPPWPAIPVMVFLAGYGIAALDPVASAWVGSLHHATGFLGMLQGFFGIGSTIAPLIANGMIEHEIPYYKFFYVPFALSMFGSLGFLISFWGENGAKYIRDTSSSKKSGVDQTKEILKNKVSWILGLFVLVNWGAEGIISNWTVVYLTDARGGSSSNASIVNSMFWLSYTIGRFVLVWVVGVIPRKWRGKGPMSFFISVSLILDLMFWLLPTFAGSSVAACLLGFFCGPLYPLILSMLTKLLPPHLHVGAIAIGSALGSAGSSVFPIAAGALGEYKGISMIHPLILGIYVLELVLWYCLPASSSKSMSAGRHG
ncbi:MFS general substrate transporter [Choiromyces venosus 120613-1]|uniref:MFS general substrate transporter n=1 Tax=Choiromyces venosus 120613-1 TaxID=1336337 RepID=A0A3N4IXA7_9PEZI|nr:MFS general substrate transporter [Choiromyces venosus 120613-1]